MVCQRAELGDDEAQTCVRCLSRVRNHLTEVERLYALLPEALEGQAGTSGSFVSIATSASAADQVIGGEAMVLYGPGSEAGNQARDIISGRNGGGEHAADEYPGDTASVLGELERWERDWRHVMGMRAATDPAMVSTCGLFLQRNLVTMAQRHPAFDEFADDMRKLVGQLRAVTHQGEPIDRGRRIPCEKCGEPLIRRYRRERPCEHSGPHCDHSHPDPVKWPCRGSNTCACDQGGRTDDWVCSSRACDVEMTDASYWLKVKERYEQEKQRRVAS